MNMYPYIPFISAHRDSIKRSFISAELNRYVLASSEENSYNLLRAKLFTRLRARGYPPSFLRPMFLSHSYCNRNDRLERALYDNNEVQKVTPFVIRDSPNARSVDWHSILTPSPEILDSDLSTVIPRPLPAFSNPPSLRFKLERGAHTPRL